MLSVQLLSRKNRGLVFFISVFLLLPKSARTAVETSLSLELRPIDLLQQNIQKNYHSRQVKVLKQAFSALKSESYSSAIKWATPIQKDDVFSDYGLWIASSAYRGLAQQQLKKKQYALASTNARKAVSLSLQILEKSPYSPFLKYLPKDLAQAEMIMGDSHWGRHEWLLAQHQYESALQRFQSQNILTQVEPTNLANFAEACNRKSTHVCRSWILKLVSSVTKNAQNEILKHFPAALIEARGPQYSGKASVVYKAQDLDQVAFELAMGSYRKGKYTDASEGFQKFLNDFPRSAHRFRARYWLAQSLSKKNEPENAQKVYTELQLDTPLSYYGILASNAIGKPIDSAIGAVLPMGVEIDPYLSPGEILHLRRAQNLIAEKAYNLAVFELREIKVRAALSSPFLVYLAMLNCKCGNYSSGFTMIGELMQRGYEGIFSTYGLRMIFPLNFANLISKYSTENSIDPILVLSLIKQESAFAEDANSSAGAMGLMQLMPTTAVDTDPAIKISALLEAEDNIRVGTKYLKKLLTRYNGNIVFALAGYNAGPTAVDRWRKEGPPVREMAEFIESIPYKETREYVSSIIRNYFWYSRQLHGTFTKDLNYFWNTYGPPESPSQLPINSQLKLRNENA